MYRLLISGHGLYGAGIANNIKMITGSDKIIVVDFIDSMPPEEYSEIVNEIVKDGNIICLCDIIGGTPFQTLAKLSRSIEEMYVLTGITPMAIIEWQFNGEVPIDVQLHNLMETSKKSVSIYPAQ